MNEERKKRTTEYEKINKLIRRNIREQRRKQQEVMIHHVIENHKSMKYLRAAIGRNHIIIALIDNQENTTTNRRQILKMTERLYEDLSK